MPVGSPVVTFCLEIPSFLPPVTPGSQGAAMQTWWFLALAVAVVHGGTIRQESGALAIAHDTDARPR